ncbi:MAG: hypothetical protein J5J00_04735 [Deltaproteobacteria bacterium]|nr:hypothetical protein [Deltaproteobacteria bacterium]
MSSAAELRVLRDLSFAEIAWQRVQESLCNNFHLADKIAASYVRDFRRRFNRPLSPSWFLGKIGVKDNIVLAGLCQAQGADILRISHRRRFWMAGLPAAASQVVEFRPELRPLQITKQGGSCTVEMTLELFKRRLPITSLSSLLAVHAAAFLLAIIFYVLVAGSFLYSLSVFVVFVMDPLNVTLSATTHGSIGIALLSFLVCSAALFGRILKKFFVMLSGKVLERVRNGKTLCDQRFPG